MLFHSFVIVDRDLMLHVGKCPISGSHCVMVEEAPELMTRGITFIKGGKHSPYDTVDTARDSVITFYL